MDLRAFWRSEPGDHRAALIVIVLTGVALRLLNLWQPMRYDESVTYLEFIRHPLSQALSRYDQPNNHVFHTLLAKGSAAAFGNAPWALRLPAFLAGVALIPLAYAVARALHNARAALIAAALVASSGVLALYSTNARGYSIVVLAFLVLVLIAARLIHAPSARLWAAFAITSAIGVWTVPVMLYPLGAAALWLALSLAVDGRKRELAWLAGALAAGVALTLIVFGPVFSRAGITAIARTNLAAPTEWTQFLGDLAMAGWDTLRSWGLGLPPVVYAAVLAAAATALARHKQLTSFRVGLPLAAFVWSAWLLVATHRAPSPRIWLWCFPVLAALAGAGLVSVLEQSKRAVRVAAQVPFVAALIAVGGAASVAASGAVLQTRDTGTFVDAEATAMQLAPILRPGDRVIAAIPTSGPLAYYFHRLGIDPAYLRLDEADAQRLIVVVNEGENETAEEVLQDPAARDTVRFVSSVIAERSLSKVLLFERRHAPR